MQSFSLGVCIANLFSAWWGDWRAVFKFDVGLHHPSGVLSPLVESRASTAWAQQADGLYIQHSAGVLSVEPGVGLLVSQAVDNLFDDPQVQSMSSWTGGGDGSMALTSDQGLAPDGRTTASRLYNLNDFSFGTQFYQALAETGADMVLSVWAYADVAADIELFINDHELSESFTLDGEVRRYDLVGKVGDTLMGGGRCGIQSSENWSNKNVYIAWMQLTVSSVPLPFALETRAADVPVISHSDLPWVGYDVSGVADGIELVPGGTFTDDTSLEGWTPTVYNGTGTTTLDVVSGQFVITNSDAAGTGFGGAYFDFDVRGGSVYVIQGEHISGPNMSDYHIGLRDANPWDIFANLSFSDTSKYFLASTKELRFLVNSAGNTPEASRVVDNISLQRIGPGVVIEETAFWGASDGQHVFRLDDGGSDDFILLRRASTGKIELAIQKDGDTLFEDVSATSWPDDREATFRLEITGTDAGAFFAVFLDEVYLGDLVPGALDYPSGINQLCLAVVAGVKTIQVVKVR